MKDLKVKHATLSGLKNSLSKMIRYFKCFEDHLSFAYYNFAFNN